jgi:clan AA aspartic protease
VKGLFTADREAVLQIEVRGPGGQAAIVSTVIDTGFTGHLTLPSDLIATLGLSYHSHTQGTLADGSIVSLAKYEAAVLWDGASRDVMVLEAAGGALVGVSTLYGDRLIIDLVDGGDVSTIPLRNEPR